MCFLKCGCQGHPGVVMKGKNRLLGLLWMAVSAAISLGGLYLLLRWLLS